MALAESHCWPAVEVRGRFEMLSAVGVDVAEAHKGSDIVALDGDRRITYIRNGLSVEAVADAILHELRPSIVCIDSPSEWAASGTCRPAEARLRRLGINAFNTPVASQVKPWNAWMLEGFRVYRALSAHYPRYCGGGVEGTAAEYFPHASAVLLAGKINHPRDKATFRRRVLEEQGVDSSKLRTLDQLDAALGALTGIRALEGNASFVGDAQGALLLPVAAIPQARLPRMPLTAAGASGAPRRTRLTPTPHTCACGCGAPGPGEFRPGHDAKLLSRLRAWVAAGDAARDELRRRGWTDARL